MVLTPAYSRPAAPAMAVMRAAMAKPPVLGSTMRPNATGRVMVPTLAGTVLDPLSEPRGSLVSSPR